MTSSSPAAAHYVYFKEYVWANADSSRCLQSYSETSHGSTGGGYFKGEARSLFDPDYNPGDCVIGWERNVGRLAEGMRVYKLYENEWLLCFKTDKWYYNSEPAVTLRLTLTAPAETLCGPGEYGMYNYAVMMDSGQWVGGEPVWSGSHYLPTSQSTSSQRTTELPPPPEWGKPGTDSPEKVKVVGSDGELVRDANGKPIKVDPVPPLPTEANSTTVSGERTFTTDENGNVTEEVVLDLVRPVP